MAAGALATGLLAGCGLGGPTDPFPPTVVITSPTLAIVTGTKVFSADAYDDSGVASVRFLVDGVLLFEDLQAPYTTLWNTTTYADGEHSLRVEARDRAGNLASVGKQVIVNNTPD